MSGGFLSRFEKGLQNVVEKPFIGEPPFDGAELRRRLLASARDSGNPYLPDRWYVRLPAALKKRDGEVRVYAEQVWRDLLVELLGNGAGELKTPPITVSYDESLGKGQMMVGYEYSTADTLVAAPRRPGAAQAGSKSTPAVFYPPAAARKRNPLVSFLRFIAIASFSLALVAVLALLVVELARGSVSLPSAPAAGGLPGIALPEVRLPQLSPGDLLRSNATVYVAREDLHVRSEPSSSAELLGKMEAGARITAMKEQIVAGETVEGESRWLDIATNGERLSGHHRYVWLGGLEAQ